MIRYFLAEAIILTFGYAVPLFIDDHWELQGVFSAVELSYWLFQLPLLISIVYFILTPDKNILDRHILKAKDVSFKALRLDQSRLSFFIAINWLAIACLHNAIYIGITISLVMIWTFLFPDWNKEVYLEISKKNGIEPQV